MKDAQTPVARLRNVGPKSAAMLEEIGVHTFEDLQNMGAVFAYRILKHRFGGVTLNMLYGLEAALRDTHWLDLASEDKERLRAESDGELLIDLGGPFRR